jgi:hypothetical protein
LICMFHKTAKIDMTRFGNTARIWKGGCFPNRLAFLSQFQSFFSQNGDSWLFAPPPSPHRLHQLQITLWIGIHEVNVTSKRQRIKCNVAQKTIIWSAKLA